MKDKKASFGEILDECMARVQAGKSIDDCLTEYPEYKDELESLLRLYVFIKAVPEVKPDASFKEHARRRLMIRTDIELIKETDKAVELFAQEREKQSIGFWQGLAFKFLAVLLVFSLIGGGVAAAAEGSLPNSPLYAVKLAVEEAQLALTFDQTAKSDLCLKLVEKRFSEVQKMVEAGETEGLEIALREMERRLEQAQERGDKFTSERKLELYRKMIELTERQQTVLGKVLEKVPEEAKEAVTHAMEVSRQGHEKAQEVLGKEIPVKQNGDMPEVPRKPGNRKTQDNGDSYDRGKFKRTKEDSEVKW